MKVFVSWSGSPSETIAKVMRHWLREVLPYTEPWLSSIDIRKGTRWSHEIGSKLDECNHGLVIVTRKNKSEPWLNFEAGALSKSVETGKVFPILFGLSPSELSGPLAQFQCTEFSQDEMRKMLCSLNEAATADSLLDDAIDEAFARTWDSLAATVNQAIADLNEDSEGPLSTPARETSSDERDDALADSEIEVLRVLGRTTPNRRDRRPGLDVASIANAIGQNDQRAQYFLDETEAEEPCPAAYEHAAPHLLDD